MNTLITQPAPEFTAQTVMPDNNIEEKTLSDLRGGRYAVLFFYPLDFTFVCPTEIVEFDKKLNEFEKRNCQVIGVSVDSQYSHFAWKNTPRDKGGIGDIKYPLVSDITKSIAESYGVLLPSGVALRGTFLIDKGGVVRHAVINDLPLGRNIDEALRMLDALLYHEKHGEVCPANWQEGQEAMRPTQEGVSTYLSKVK